VPILPGCISEGDTFEEAKKNIVEAIELYLEVTKPKISFANLSDFIVAPVTVHA
jgi:predicted RNase H-like HicB family nuclease